MTKVERENLVALCKAIAERIAKQYVAQGKVQEIVTTESHGENVHDDRYYKKEEVVKAISDEITKIVDGAPESLNTLREVADWITDDKTGAAAMAKSIAGKADKDHTHDQYLTEHQDISGKADKDHTHSQYLTAHQSLTGYVPTSRTVNGKALSGNITLDAGDVGAAASNHTHNQLDDLANAIAEIKKSIPDAGDALAKVGVYETITDYNYKTHPTIRGWYAAYGENKVKYHLEFYQYRKGACSKPFTSSNQGSSGYASWSENFYYVTRYDFPFPLKTCKVTVTKAADNSVRVIQFGPDHHSFSESSTEVSTAGTNMHSPSFIRDTYIGTGYSSSNGGYLSSEQAVIDKCGANREGAIKISEHSLFVTIDIEGEIA